MDDFPCTCVFIRFQGTAEWRTSFFLKLNDALFVIAHHGIALQRILPFLSELDYTLSCNSHLEIALQRILPFLPEPDYTLSRNSSPRNPAAAYISIPFRTKLYATSQNLLGSPPT